MHTGVAEDLQPMVDNAKLTIRVGLHYGPVIHEKGDVFGDAVNVAARMAGRAKAEQIITTADTVAALSTVWRDSTRWIDTMPVKGKSADMAIHEVIWQPDEATQLATQFATSIPAAPTDARLTLRFRGTEMEMTRTTGVAVLGRDQNAFLTVNTPKASRQHVRIECLRGKFVLSDQSTNGTYVKTTGGERFLRSGENIMLTGEGEISLGQSFEENSDVVVYCCEN